MSRYLQSDCVHSQKDWITGRRLLFVCVIYTNCKMIQSKDASQAIWERLSVTLLTGSVNIVMLELVKKAHVNIFFFSRSRWRWYLTLRAVGYFLSCYIFPWKCSYFHWFNSQNKDDCFSTKVQIDCYCPPLIKVQYIIQYITHNSIRPAWQSSTQSNIIWPWPTCETSEAITPHLLCFLLCLSHTYMHTRHSHTLKTFCLWPC